MIIKNLKQGSDEWFTEKLGKPSASNIDNIVTSQGKVSTQRKGYLYTLVAERITGKRDDTFKNEAMEMGNAREAESRDLVSFVTGHEIEEVGVVYKDEQERFLCSPDGLVNNREYGLELKNVLGKTQVGYLLENKVPTKYVVQIQTSLYVTGLPFWMFCSYSPALEPLIIKVPRNDLLIKMIGDSLNKFCDELDFLSDKLKEKK